MEEFFILPTESPGLSERRSAHLGGFRAGSSAARQARAPRKSGLRLRARHRFGFLHRHGPIDCMIQRSRRYTPRVNPPRTPPITMSIIQYQATA